MSEVVRIDGLKELNEKLLAMEPKLRRKTLGKALRKAGTPILKEAKILVPVDTGKLRDNLKLRSRGPSKKRPHRQSVAVTTPTRKQLEMTSDETGYYPAVLEYGSASRGLPPRSYLRAAMAIKSNEALNTLKTELAAGVVKAAKS